MRNHVIDELMNLASKDKRAFLVTADLGYNVIEKFRDAFPDRYLNVGIAEQNMCSVAYQSFLIPWNCNDHVKALAACRACITVDDPAWRTGCADVPVCLFCDIHCYGKRLRCCSFISRSLWLRNGSNSECHGKYAGNL